MARLARVPFTHVLRPQFVPRPADTPVETLGCWQIGPLLHTGSFHQIYAARIAASPPDAPWAYVLKRLQGDALDHPEVVNLITQEALVGSRVRHPHLTTVVDAQVDGAPYFVVQPRLPGQTLARWVATARDIGLPNALWTARQVAEALGALHEQGWLHGDVKPDNIIVSPDGHATLIDLAFARRLSQSGSAAERPVLAGTCNYLPPEAIRSTAGLGVASDLYSLGATLYEMLSGTPPYSGRSLAETAAAHRRSRPPTLETLRPELPAAVTHLVCQLLARDPLRRPSSAREVVRQLIALEIATFGEHVIQIGQ